MFPWVCLLDRSDLLFPDPVGMPFRDAHQAALSSIAALDAALSRLRAGPPAGGLPAGDLQRRIADCELALSTVRCALEKVAQLRQFEREAETARRTAEDEHRRAMEEARLETVRSQRSAELARLRAEVEHLRAELNSREKVVTQLQEEIGILLSFDPVQALAHYEARERALTARLQTLALASASLNAETSDDVRRFMAEASILPVEKMRTEVDNELARVRQALAAIGVALGRPS